MRLLAHVTRDPQRHLASIYYQQSVNLPSYLMMRIYRMVGAAQIVGSLLDCLA
jgi:hypothetical protein